MLKTTIRNAARALRQSSVIQFTPEFALWS